MVVLVPSADVLDDMLLPDMPVVIVLEFPKDKLLLVRFWDGNKLLKKFKSILLLLRLMRSAHAVASAIIITNTLIPEIYIIRC